MTKYGIGKGTVLKLLRDNGAQLRNQGLSADQLAKATELYSSGQSLATIGKQMGLHHSSIHWALRGAGVVMRSAHQRRNRAKG